MWTGAEIDEAITENTGLVRLLARHTIRRLPASVELDDLVQDGMIGLLDAATKFDPARGDPFPNFAVGRIRGAMLDGLRVNDWFPRSVRTAQKSLDRARRAAAHRLGRAASAAEIAAELQMPIDALQKLIGEAHGAEMLPLDDMYRNDGDDSEGWLERHVLDVSDEPLALLEEKQFEAELAAAMLSLSGRQRDVMKMLYVEDLNLKAVAARIGVTESRACQIRVEIVRRLRAKLCLTA